MAKRKERGINVVASMPWPIGFVLGIVAYVAIRYGVGWYFSTVNNPVLQGMARQASTGAYASIAWIVLIMCWIGAVASFVRGRHRRHLLETQTGLDSLRAINWREFEMLLGEAFRRQGYAVRETGLGAADGGIDLILHKKGNATLVQCKQWKTQRVDVKVVREMFGLMEHHRAKSVKIVAIGDYTAEAHRFVEGKPIELINGDVLLAMVREVQTRTPDKIDTVTSHHANKIKIEPTISLDHVCPKCGANMVKRLNRQTKEQFWGCVKYPACRGTTAT